MFSIAFCLIPRFWHVVSERAYAESGIFAPDLARVMLFVPPLRCPLMFTRPDRGGLERPWWVSRLRCSLSIVRKRKNDKGLLLGIVILALLGVIIMHPVISGIIIAVIVLLAVLHAMAHKQQTQDLGNVHISPTGKKRHGPRGKHEKRPADEMVPLNDNAKPADNDDGLPADYVALDTETTGLRAQMDQIIEIGAVKVRGRSVVDSFDTLVDPGSSLDSRIVELTGITDAMLDGQPKIGDALPLF